MRFFSSYGAHPQATMNTTIVKATAQRAAYKTSHELVCHTVVASQLQKIGMIMKKGKSGYRYLND